MEIHHFNRLEFCFRKQAQQVKHKILPRFCFWKTDNAIKLAHRWIDMCHKYFQCSWKFSQQQANICIMALPEFMDCGSSILTIASSLKRRKRQAGLMIFKERFLTVIAMLTRWFHVHRLISVATFSSSSPSYFLSITVKNHKKRRIDFESMDELFEELPQFH